MNRRRQLSSPVYLGFSRRIRCICVTVVATVTMVAAALIEAAPASADTVSSSSPPGLLNLSALQLPATASATGNNCSSTCFDVYYPNGVYSATPDQVTSLEDLENEAVSDTIADHALNLGDATEVLSWGRADADAELWALLVQAIEAVKANTATTDQKNAADWLTNVVVREGVLAADDAGLEYTQWAGLGTAAFNQLIDSAPSLSALENFLGGVVQPYTDGGSASDPSLSTDGGYCVYQSPSPYQGDYVANIYNVNTVPQTCFTPCTNPLGCNITTPTSDQFIKWGEADADNTLFDNSSYAGAAQNIAIGASLAAVGTVGSVAAGLGTTFSLGSTLAGTSFQEAVFTYAARALKTTIDAAEAAAEAAGESAEEAAQGVVDAAMEVGGEVAATGVGVIVAAVIFAVVTAVQEGLIVFGSNGLPDDLAQNIIDAPSATPDLSSMLSNSSEIQGLYGLFVGATLPAPTFTGCDNSALTITTSGGFPVANTPCLNATPVPAQSPYDPQWVVTPKGGTTSTTQPTLSWQDTSTGLNTTTYLNGNWFISSTTVGGTSATTQNLRLQYTDWNGDEQTAWLFANASPAEFLTVSDSALGANFDPNTCLTDGTCSVTSSLDVIGSDGNGYSVSVTGGAEVPPQPPATPLCLVSSAGPPSCLPPITSSTTLAGPTTVQLNQPANFTATVGANYLSGSEHTQGTVAFSANFAGLCPDVSVPAGTTSTQVSCTATFTHTGTEYLFATFSDGVGDTSSQAELTVDVVNQVPTTTSLAPSTTTPVVGQPVTYTATVSDTTGAVPTGSVTFTNGSTTLCSAVPLSTSAPYNATCSATYGATSAGQTVTATYSGSTTTLGSHDDSTLPVGQASSSTGLVPSISAPVVGQPVTYSATVKLLAPDTSGPAPSGSVTFTNGSATLCAAVQLSVSAPYTATCKTTYQSPSNTQTVTADYSGDNNTIGSQAQSTLAVGQAATATSLQPAPGAPVFGQAVSLKAQVNPAAPSTSGPAPTGMVTFTVDGNQVGGPVSLAGGQATSAPITNLAPGVHQVAVSYAGDTNYTGSGTSSSLTVGCTTTITASYSGPLTVKPGTCVEGGTVSGPVNLAPGGTLAVIGGSITGPLTVNGAASVLVCGSTVQGPISITGSTGPVAFGGVPGSTCGPDQLLGPVTVKGDSGSVAIQGSKVAGPVTITSDTGAVVLSSNRISGPVTLNGNTSASAPTVSANTVGAPLSCSSNNPAPTDSGSPNIVTGPAGGQCAGLA